MTLVLMLFVLLVAWALLLRFGGGPGRRFVAVGAGLVLLSLALGNAADTAEKRDLPIDCQTGAAHGLKCGFGIGYFVGLANAVLGVACLAFLAVLSLLIRRTNRPRTQHPTPPEAPASTTPDTP
jgi:membrane protease YdiL (CAAX protease family)